MPAKGTTNNPNGRPPKSRALTDLLVKALSKKVDTNDGKQLPRKAVLAELVADVLATGRLQFPGDTETSVISIKDWLEFAKWAYQYLEPPPQRQEVTGADGGAVKVQMIEVVLPPNDNASD
jgi:hypothetical protein